jgi:hypothetical protein
VLVIGFGKTGIRGDAGNVQAIADIGCQQFRRHLDVLGNLACVVDDDIPLAAAQRVDLAIAIANERLDVRNPLGTVFAAIEMRYTPTQTQSLLRQMRTDESGAAQNQQGPRLRIGGNRLWQQTIGCETGAQLQNVTACGHGGLRYRYNDRGSL